MNTIELREFKKGLKLTNIQQEILVGTLLGDSHLSNYKTAANYKLMVEHGLSQKAYTDWLYNVYKNWVLNPPKVKDQIVNGKLYKKYRFNTISHVAFRFYAANFIRTVKKLCQS